MGCTVQAAEAFETRSAAESTAEVLGVLRGIFEPRGIAVPAPLQVGAALADPHAFKTASV